MGLDDRLGALRTAVDGGDGPEVDAPLGAVRQRVRVRRRRRRVLGASLVVLVVVALAGLAAAWTGGEGAQRVTSTPEEGAAPPPIDRSAAHLWLSAEAVPPEGADLAVVIVDPTSSGDTWGVAAEAERWDGAGWQPVDDARLCMDFWGCVGQIGGVDGVEGIGLTASPVGPLTWIDTGELAPGWYRLTQTSNEGTVAAGQFEVRADAPASPPAEDEVGLSVRPVLRSTALTSTAVAEGIDGMPLGDLAGASLRLERWVDGGWVEPDEGAGPGFVFGASTVTDVPGAEPGRGAAIDLGLGFLDGTDRTLPPGAYRLTLIGSDGSELVGRYWVADEPSLWPPESPEPSAPDGSATEEEAWGVPVGDRTPVAGTDDAGNRWVGYVNWDVIAGQDADAPPIAPVYAEPGPSSDEGTIVGYWGTDVGWIQQDVVEASTLSDDALLAQLIEEEQNREQGGG